MQSPLKIEHTILKNLIQNENFTKKVLPFLKIKYFKDNADRRLFMEIKDFFLTYDRPPEYDVLDFELQQKKGFTEDDLKTCRELIDGIKTDNSIVNFDWLVDTTEKFCQEKAIYLAMVDSMAILNGQDKKNAPGAIPNLLQEALAISFEPNIGHDYLLDTASQLAYYHRAENKIPFELASFNKATDGGIPDKTLTVGMAGVGVGKTLTMCAFAAGWLMQGHDVLYISLEMSKNAIVQRIDANLMNLAMNTLKTLPEEEYVKRAELFKSKTQGRLIVQEYPTGSASNLHFEALLNELRIKKNFVPQFVIIDYINLCASSRVKAGMTNSYGYIKSISEELRGMAVKHSTRVFTATQVNRQGFNMSDPDLTNTAESFGLPATADMFFAITETEELKQLGQYMIIQLKNRFHDKNFMPRWIIGVDKPKMKIFDTDNAQKMIDPSTGTVSNSAGQQPKKKMFFDEDFKINEEKTKDFKW